jgi:ATP-dependent protease ClpP protease subunit
MNRAAIPNANSLIEEQLTKHSCALEDILKSDVLTVISPIAWGVDDLIRDAIEARKPKRRHISLVLETDGGYIEVAQRIADTIRHHLAA